MVICLVTGADGFAGSHLVEELLSRDCYVIALARSSPTKYLKSFRNPKLRIIQGDILDYGLLQKALWGVDNVYHLAAISGIEETRRMLEQTWEVNTRGTLNVIRACVENSVKRLLYASTCHVFGAQNKYPITEKMAPTPIDIYSASKLSGELLCRSLSNLYPELEIVITRAFNHFGPRQRPEWLVPRIVMQALHSDTITLQGSQTTRDFSYVKDIVCGYAEVMLHGKPKEIYNLCSGVELSVPAIVDKITGIMGWDGTVRFTESRKSDMMRSVGNPFKIDKQIGWTAPGFTTENVEHTIKWYSQQ